MVAVQGAKPTYVSGYGEPHRALPLVAAYQALSFALFVPSIKRTVGRNSHAQF